MTTSDFTDALVNPLQDDSAKDIELATQKALSELTEKPFHAELKRLDYFDTRDFFTS